MPSLNKISQHTLLKAYLLIGFFSFHAVLIFSQDQRLSDSLETIYNSGKYDQSQKLKILNDLVESETDAEKILSYSLILITEATNADSAGYIFEGHLRLGDAYRLKGDLTHALESYFEAAKVAHDNELQVEEASINITIADVYSIMDDGPTSVTYYKKALNLLDLAKDSLTLASAQLNLGDEYYNQGKLDSALYYFNKSGQIFKEKNYELGTAYNLGNVGLVYAEKEEHDKAQENLYKAMDMLKELGDYYPICVYLNAMADVYEAKGQMKKSISYARESLEMAKEHGLKDQISDSSLKLSKFYENAGNTKQAFNYYKEHIDFRDQVKSVQEVQKMANVRTEYEVSRKQIEVDLLNQEKKIQRYVVIGVGIALFLIGLLALSLLRQNKLMEKTNKIIAAEKQRSDDLLKNILPEETAVELKENGSVKAKRFDQVSVLFTDFKSFAQQSEDLAPESLVKSIDYYFSKFDEIIDKYDLEKIKTIGDSYMCAGGLPFPTKDHAIKTCLAGLEIVDFVRKTNQDVGHDLKKFEIRVGINTGPVVAGVVGTKKFQYDIWGDAVNTASRMESSSEVGKVNISEATYNIVNKLEKFNFTSRGSLDVKGKGKVSMYFVDSKN